MANSGDAPGDRPPPSKPTLLDVARAAGVSRAMASIVLRDAPGAREATRERVRRAAAEIGYRPDLNARYLRRGSGRLVGVAFRLTSAFMADIVRLLNVSASRAGYDVLLGGWDDEASERRGVATLLGYRSSALILLGTTLPTADVAEAADTVPLVTIGRRTQAPNADSIVTDERVGMRLVIDHLVGLGHERIVHVDGGDAVASERRRTGYLEAMHASGLETETVVVHGGETPEAGVAAADRILGGAAQPTAIAAYNDECAWGLIARFEQGGLAVPASVSVAGYDGGRYSTLLPHPLTTVRQDRERYAELAMDQIVNRLEHGDATPRHHRLTPALVLGHSTAERTR